MRIANAIAPNTIKIWLNMVVNSEQQIKIEGLENVTVNRDRISLENKEE